MRHLQILITLLVTIFLISACGNEGEVATMDDETVETSTVETTPGAGQSAVVDEESAKDIVKVAVSSPDHTTLVKAIQQAELVDALSNAGPFTVFAPTNAAFDKVPKETLENLMKDENKDQLKNVLYYHVTPAKYTEDRLQDGMKLGMVDMNYATITKENGQLKINGANIIGSVPASNGIIYVIDEVILPK